MMKKYYDFNPDTLGMFFTAIFSALTTALLIASVSYGGIFSLFSSTYKQEFLSTPAGILIALSSVAIVIMALVSIRYKMVFPYIMVPMGIAGVLFAIRPILIQGDISIFLELPSLHFWIALIRGILGILVIIFLFLLVTNIVPYKRYLMIALIASILWYFATEAYLYLNAFIGRFYLYNTSQTKVLFSQLAYYFVVIFYTFSIKPVKQEDGTKTDVG